MKTGEPIYVYQLIIIFLVTGELDETINKILIRYLDEILRAVRRIVFHHSPASPKGSIDNLNLSNIHSLNIKSPLAHVHDS